MTRNPNPEWFYGWDQEPEDDHNDVEIALDDDADAYFDRCTD